MSREDLLFTKEHAWLRIVGDTGTVGISDHAQKELGDIVYVELPKTGTKFDSGDTFGSVESVKAVSELYIPVSAEVIEINRVAAGTITFQPLIQSQNSCHRPLRIEILRLRCVVVHRQNGGEHDMDVVSSRQLRQRRQIGFDVLVRDRPAVASDVVRSGKNHHHLRREIDYILTKAHEHL